MADSDKSLDILIRLGVINKADAVAAKQLIEETGEATKKTGQKTKEAGEEVDRFSTKGGDMKKLLHSLNEVLPGLGTALKVAFHPESLGLTGMMLALGALKGSMESMKQFSAELKAMTANASQPGSDILETMRQVNAEAAKSAVEIEKWIKGLNDTFAEQDRKLKLTLSGIQQQEAATLKLIEAQTNLRKIQIETGGGTDAEKQAALIRLGGESSAAKAGASAASEQEQIRILQQNLGVAQANAAISGDRVGSASAAAGKFGSEARSAAAEAQARAQLEDAKARLAKANETISGIENPGILRQVGRYLPTGQVQWEQNMGTAAVSDAESAQREIAQANAVLDQLAQRKLAEESANRALAESRVEYSKASGAVRSLSNELEALTRKIRIANGVQPAIDSAAARGRAAQIENITNHPH